MNDYIAGAEDMWFYGLLDGTLWLLVFKALWPLLAVIFVLGFGSGYGVKKFLVRRKAQRWMG